MGCFPLFVDIRDREALIIGGGEVALRKVEKLLPFGVHLTVIAPGFHPELQAMAGLRLEKRQFRMEDISDNLCMVIAATDNRETNRLISGICRSRRIPVNVVDDPQLCTFIFPALIVRGSLTVGITTGGACPAASAVIRGELEQSLPDRLQEILDWLTDQRQLLKAGVDDQHVRASLLRRLTLLSFEKGRPLEEHEIEAALESE